MTTPELLGPGSDRAPENENHVGRYIFVKGIIPLKESDTGTDMLRVVAQPQEVPQTIDAEIKKEPQLYELASIPQEPKRSIQTRAFSLVILFAVVAVFAMGGLSAYHAFTDSFIAPLILSPDSDMVVQNKLSLSRLLSEREHLVARIDEDTAAIDGAGRSVAVLKEIQSASFRTQNVFGAERSHETTTGRKELLAVLQRQEKYVAALEHDLEAGLIHEADLVREQNALNHIRVALLQDQRENLSAQTQLARINLDLLKNEAEQRARIAQRRATQEELARLDELLSELRLRPIFRAVETSQTLGFVPYSQREGVRPGAAIYLCKLWGMLGCTQVGTITAIFPGEVVAQDPWGATARGEYAVLDLTDTSAAQYKSLRVRGGGDASPADEKPSVMLAQ